VSARLGAIAVPVSQGHEPSTTATWLATRLAAFSPLGAILTLQAIASLSLRNTAFQDESIYLYAGRELAASLHGGPPPSEAYATYFSGWPLLYPVIAGSLDTVGGLEAARLLSLLCMLGATVAVYVLGREIFDRSSGLLGAALFAVQGSVLFLGRLATYDALCLALLALAAVIAVRARPSHRLAAAIVVGVWLALAVASKYAGLLFVPSLLVLFGWQSMRGCGWRWAALHVLLTGLVLGLCLGLVLVGNPDVRAGLEVTTIARSVIDVVSRWSLVAQAVTEGGLLLAFSCVGLLMANRQRRFVALTLMASALLPLAYHLYKDEIVSFHKHIAFGLLFAAPLAGYATARLAGCAQYVLLGSRWPSALAVCLLAFGLGLPQGQALYAEWPDSDAMVHVLRTQVRPVSSQILVEEPEVSRYYLQDVVGPGQWHNLYWFQYTDTAGRTLTGQDAYTAAINDGYFDLVVLHYGWNAELAHAIDGGLRDGTRYELLTQVPYDTAKGPGAYWIWRKRNA
jgi:hypothetical protein